LPLPHHAPRARPCRLLSPVSWGTHLLFRYIEHFERSDTRQAPGSGSHSPALRAGARSVGLSAMRGLGMTLPGSSGTPSRPATTRLLALPALSRAAHAARRSSAPCNTVSGNWAMFPLRFVNFAWILITPGAASAEEALST